MARTLDLALLRCFVAVADRASMTAAARALHLTQGAVSQQIRRLEDQLGATLFDRDRRGLRLTAAGERMLGRSREMLGLNDALWAEMTGGALSGRLRLGAPFDLVGCRIAPAMKRFAEAWPQVEVSLVCAASPELAASLGQGTLDLAVIEAPPGASGAECLAVEQLVWVGARGGAAHRRRPLPVSMVAEACAFRPAVLAALHRHGRAWRTLFEAGSIEATTATVGADLAVSVFLASTVPPGLETLPAEAGLPELPPFAIDLHLPRDATPAAAELARHLRQAFA